VSALPALDMADGGQLRHRLELFCSDRQRPYIWHNRGDSIRIAWAHLLHRQPHPADAALRRTRSHWHIYANGLNIPERAFSEGFPGVTNRIEWFAMDYTGRFWIETPGEYKFALTSDDRGKLYIDGRLAIDDDGIHLSERRTASVELNSGVHRIRVSYFQGPRYMLALILEVAAPKGHWRIFNTDEYKPPPDPDDWGSAQPRDPRASQ
jgi:hypothetical protein